jgi:hypothetical protein
MINPEHAPKIASQSVVTNTTTTDRFHAKKPVFK